VEVLFVRRGYAHGCPTGTVPIARERTGPPTVVVDRQDHCRNIGVSISYQAHQDADDELVVIVPPDHKWVQRSRVVSASELAQTPLVTRSHANSAREHAIH
jgi:DNA-binding transcriptional LysR family regulator